MTDFVTSIGNGRQEILLRVTETSTNPVANTSQVQLLLYLIRVSGTGAWSNFTNNSWSEALSSPSQGTSGSGTYDLRGGGTILLLNATFTVAHDPSTGAKTISVSGAFTDPNSGGIGSASTGGSFALTTLPQVPGAPSLSSIDHVTASGARANYTAPGSIGGSAITGYTTQFSTSPTFSSGITSVAGDAAADPVSATGLTPSSAYYVRTKATNTQGDSAWSGTLTFNTAAAGAPHIAAIPHWDGSGIHVVLENPFNTTGATFTVTRTVSGPGAPAQVTLAVSTVGFVFDALVLAVGQTATYRATATIGGATTGSSPSVSVAYTAVSQVAPAPPIFDGSLVIPAPLGDTETASWLGAADVSPSLIYGKHPKGWRNFDQGSAGLATGAVTQIDQILATNQGNGQFDVMAIFGSTQSGAGVRVGTEVLHAALMIDVFGNVVYYGSILAQVDVATNLAAEIEWYGSNGLLIGRAVGATVAMSPNVPVTLVVSGTAPANAVYAAVDTVDVGGAGWSAGSLRFAGSAMLSASAQYPYFDGDTLDTTQYSYAWQGSANASPSLRTSLAQSGGSSLQDPDDPVIPVAPQAPIVDDSQILTDVVWRRYVAAVPEADIRAWMVSVPTLTLFTAAAAERQVRIRFWKNPNNIDPSIWTDTGSNYDSEQIISYIPPNVAFVIDGVAELAYVDFPASPTQDASTVAADHLLFGDGGGPATWPELACGVGYILTLDVPLTSTPGNITQVLELTDRLL